jgi:uncharacterized membrane protein
MSNEPKTKQNHIRRHFLMGIAVGAPIVLTLWLVWAAIEMIDGRVMPLIPQSLIPADNILRIVPGVGVLVFFVSAVILGVLTRGWIGRTLVKTGEAIFERLPVIRSIYSSVKQITDTIFGQEGPKFEKACLVEYPRKGAWSIAFISTDAKGEVRERLSEHGNILSLFIPTTPNPTSGFLLFVPESDVIMLDMGVDDAAKLSISAGLVYPNPKNPEHPVIAANDPKINQ